MSVLIKDMEKPKSCYAVIDGEYEYCPFVNTDDDCVLLLNKGTCEGTWEMQYSKCPLVELSKPCEDTVSRKAVEEMLQNGFPARGMWEIEGDVVKQTVCETLADALMDLEKLPSVTPKRKAGRWIEEQRGIKVTQYKCSECGRTVIDDTTYDVAEDYPFCHCGADMRQREESK